LFDFIGNNNGDVWRWRATCERFDSGNLNAGRNASLPLSIATSLLRLLVFNQPTNFAAGYADEQGPQILAVLEMRELTLPNTSEETAQRGIGDVFLVLHGA
jgi:hypothetical protein